MLEQSIMSGRAVQFTLRPLTSDDEDAVLDIYRGCEDFLALGPVAVASLEMVRADMRHSVEMGSRFCGIFDDDGRMQGIVDYLRTGFEGDPACGFLELMMIAQPYRRGGLGTAVVAQVETEIRRDKRVTRIESGVQMNNPAAIHFWRKLGYRIVSEARDMGDGTSAYHLQKELHSLET